MDFVVEPTTSCNFDKKNFTSVIYSCNNYSIFSYNRNLWPDDILYNDSSGIQHKGIDQNDTQHDGYKKILNVIISKFMHIVV